LTLAEVQAVRNTRPPGSRLPGASPRWLSRPSGPPRRPLRCRRRPC